MAGPLMMIFALLLSAVAARRARRTRFPARAVIIPPRKSTVIARDGAVRSVQTAELTMEAAKLELLWHPSNLENLGRTYWRFLTRVTLGLIRVIYGEHTRSVVLIAKPLTLLRFDAPEYVLDGSHGAIRWRGAEIYLSEALIGEPVGLVERQDGGCTVHYGPIELGVIDHRGNRLRRPKQTCGFVDNSNQLPTTPQAQQPQQQV